MLTLLGEKLFEEVIAELTLRRGGFLIGRSLAAVVSLSLSFPLS